MSYEGDVEMGDVTPPAEEAGGSPPLSPERAPKRDKKRRGGEGGGGERKKARRDKKQPQQQQQQPSKPSAAGIIPSLDGSAKKKRQSKFLVTLAFDTSLPAPPAPPKFLALPRDDEQLYRYTLSALERRRRHELLEEPVEGGIELNAVAGGAWERGGGGGGDGEENGDIRHDPRDKVLLEAGPADGRDPAKGGRKHRPSNPGVTWLRRANYMTSSLAVSSSTPGFKRHTSEAAAAEAEASGRHHGDKKAGRRRRRRGDDDGGDGDDGDDGGGGGGGGGGSGNDDEPTDQRGREIADIKATFRAAASGQAPRHPTKPGMRALSVRPLLPSLELRDEDLAMVRFDTVPDAELRRDYRDAGAARAAVLRTILMERVPDMSKVKAASHALYARPEADADAGADADADADAVRPAVAHRWVREYDVRPTPAVNVDDNFFFIETEDAIHYARIDARLFLRKKALSQRDSDGAAMELLLGRADSTPANAMPKRRSAEAVAQGGDEAAGAGKAEAEGEEGGDAENDDTAGSDDEDKGAAGGGGPGSPTAALAPAAREEEGGQKEREVDAGSAAPAAPAAESDRAGEAAGNGAEGAQDKGAEAATVEV